MTATMKNDEDQSSLLLSSVLCYLNTNGFSKPLKRLLSDANIQDESWKSCSLKLEDMFKHYLDTRSDSSVNAKSDTLKGKELLSNGTKKVGDDPSTEEVVIKKKKKKGDSDNTTTISNDVELKTKKKTKKGSDAVEETEQVTEQATEEQKDKKKKNKHKSEAFESNVDTEEEVKSEDKKKKSAEFDGNGEANPDVEGKSKEKKKKKKKQKSESAVENTNNPLEVESNDKKKEEESASKMLSNGVTEVAIKQGIEEGKKESKKRKRSDSDENEMGTPLTNGNHEVKGGESTGNKSRKKDNNGSAEPKSVTAFQRVKIDDVKFADERLQDNSYWAKDGADVGYGAKAQEVLGQVRGRDFRHEKTKKKRGSYRGGQIDLHSHSVKFNYDDED